MAEQDRQALVACGSRLEVLTWQCQRDRSRVISARHMLRNVKSDSSEISVGSLLFLGLFVLAAALIMILG